MGGRSVIMLYLSVVGGVMVIVMVMVTVMVIVMVVMLAATVAADVVVAQLSFLLVLVLRRRRIRKMRGL